MKDAEVLLGYEVGSGSPVSIPLRHMAVTGQTQESGKTTTLEALAARAGVDILAFVTKRGEGSFANAQRVQPYFHDRADWQFVTSLLDATLQEKNKFLRPWIMKICRTTKTLADVQSKVREALKTARGINEGVYTQLEAYLDLIVPEIRRADLASSLKVVGRGVSVMDVSSFPTPMQMLFVQSALDWVNEHNENTIVVVPEAWEFIPEGKGSPAKASAVTLVRKGAGIGNRIWVDSQDMAGVDKVILRGCAVWLIGVQREANEIKRNLSNIPASIKRPTAAAVANLDRGQFYACWGSHSIKTYVQPAWMTPDEAIAHARGESVAPSRRAQPPKPVTPKPKEEPTVNEREAQALRDENADLRRQLEALTHQIRPVTTARSEHVSTARSFASPIGFDEANYQEIKRRLTEEAPALLRVLVAKPQIDVEISRQTIQIDGSKPTGRIARLIAKGWFDGEGRTQGGTRAELSRTGPDINPGNISTIFSSLVKDGFLTAEGNKLYRAVPDMKINIVER